MAPVMVLVEILLHQPNLAIPVAARHRGEVDAPNLQLDPISWNDIVQKHAFRCGLPEPVNIGVKGVCRVRSGRVAIRCGLSAAKDWDMPHKD